MSAVNVEYKGMTDALVKIVAKEGPGGLFKGEVFPVGLHFQSQSHLMPIFAFLEINRLGLVFYSARTPHYFGENCLVTG